MHVDIEVECFNMGLIYFEQTWTTKYPDSEEGGTGKKCLVKTFKKSQFPIEDLPKKAIISIAAITVSLYSNSPLRNLFTYH